MLVVISCYCNSAQLLPKNSTDMSAKRALVANTLIFVGTAMGHVHVLTVILLRQPQRTRLASTAAFRNLAVDLTGGPPGTVAPTCRSGK